MTTSTESSESFQIPLEAAECYESAFVPAFFAQWAPILCEAAGVGPGQRLLDVACGTGIVARTAAGLVAPDGLVVGLDLNEAMLTVARRVSPGIEFHQGDAAALPFPAGSFDVVACQLALMFFPDRAQALAEMARVVTPGGTVAVVVPSRLDAQVAFAPFVDLAGRHAGPEAMSLLSAYFVCGDLNGLTGLIESAGLRVTNTHSHMGILPSPVRRCHGDHGGREHPARRTPQRRGVPAHPHRCPRCVEAVHRSGRQRRGTLRLSRSGSTTAMSGTGTIRDHLPHQRRGL